MRLIKKLALLYRMVRQSFSFAEKAAFFRHFRRKFVLFSRLEGFFSKKGLTFRAVCGTIIMYSYAKGNLHGSEPYGTESGKGEYGY
ncbi:MAG: hypothetical protein ACI4J8_06920 [Oscillospiraceae bacterium]